MIGAREWQAAARARARDIDTEERALRQRWRYYDEMMKDEARERAAMPCARASAMAVLMNTMD